MRDISISNDIIYIGADDKDIELFENQYDVPNGVSYNSYLLLDESTVLFDTIDWSSCRQLLANIEHLLNGRKLDYIVINHVINYLLISYFICFYYNILVFRCNFD